MATSEKKTLIQCDFDGTITEDDVSFLIYDVFGDKEDWRRCLEQYRAGTLTVNDFNKRAFSCVHAGKAELLKLVLKSGRVAIKPGFSELVDYCTGIGIEFTIVSNGLDFYIEAILDDLGLSQVPYYSATSRFENGCIDVDYIGPKGDKMETGFKEAYAELFLGQGYRVFYIGNGFSDYPAASRCQHIFATSELVECCERNGAAYTPFTDLNDVVSGLKNLEG